MKIKTPEELLADILKDDPDYVAPKIKKISYLHKPEDQIDESKAIPLTLADIKKDKPKQIEYIFYPCLPTQGLAFIYAPTGLGKTLFALNLAYAIAGGGDFLKYTCPKQRKVLYVDGEMAYNQMWGRISNVVEHHGDIDDDLNFSLLTPDKIQMPMPQIDTAEGQQYYLDLIEKKKYDVVFWDNISTLTSFDENISREFKPTQNFLLKLRSRGVTSIAVHHSGKNSKGYRGTSKMLDCADLGISLQPILDEGEEDTNPAIKKFKVVYQKARIFSGIDSMPFEVNLENNIWSHRTINQSDLDKVVARLNCGLTQREIAKEMCISQTKVNRLIKEARLKNIFKK